MGRTWFANESGKETPKPEDIEALTISRSRIDPVLPVLLLWLS